MWLDIEYAAEHKYFIWDQKTFPDPDWMLKELEATGRKVCLHPVLQSRRLTQGTARHHRRPSYQAHPRPIRLQGSSGSRCLVQAAGRQDRVRGLVLDRQQ